MRLRMLAQIGQIYHGRAPIGLRFTADPGLNRQGNAAWKACIKRPTLLADIAHLQ